MFETTLLLDFISNITGNNHGNAVVLILVEDAEDQQEKLKLVNIIETHQAEIRDKYIGIIESKLLEVETEAKEIKNIEEYDGNRNNLYYYFNNDQLTQNLKFFEKVSLQNLQHYNIQSNDKIKGIIIKISTGNDEFDIFIPHYSFQQLNRDKNFFIIPMNDQFKIMENENILQFGHLPLLISYKDKILCFDFSKIEKSYGYKDQLNKKATEKLQKIFDVGFIEDMLQIQELLDTNSTLRNKILNIKDDSLVFTIGLERIKRFVSTKRRFNFDYAPLSGKFSISNKTQAKNLIIILNDDILKSELTNQEYETDGKTKVD